MRDILPIGVPGRMFLTTYAHKEATSMKILEEHFNHGAALNQIAEHKSFTAINALKVKGKTYRSAFKINDRIAVYLKYCTNPKGRYREYQFTFSKSQLRELTDIGAVGDNLHLALVCVKDREICCIPYKDFTNMIEARQEDAGCKEDQYQLLVTLKKSQAFRIYMNQYGRKNAMLGKEQKVTRKSFPNELFK